MPYKEIRVAPALFLQHQGVKIYHTYPEDQVAAGPSTYHYTTDRLHDGDELVKFDVRDLKTTNAQLLKAHPPFLTASDERWQMADDATREQWRQEWKEWTDHGERQAIKAVLREAIRTGLISRESVIDL